MISWEILGRPAFLQFSLPSYFWAMSLRYQPSTVSGVNRTVVASRSSRVRRLTLAASLLLEIVDGLPELFVNAVRQARHERKPEVLFHGPDRLMGPAGGAQALWSPGSASPVLIRAYD